MEHLTTGFTRTQLGTNVSFEFDVQKDYSKLVNTILDNDIMISDEKNYWLKTIKKMSPRSRASFKFLIDRQTTRYNDYSMLRKWMSVDMKNDLLEERKAFRKRAGLA